MPDNTQTIENLYDTEEVQKIPVGEGVLAVFKSYSDARYLQYRANLAAAINEKLKMSEGESDVNEAEIKQAIVMDCQLCDELLENLEGYEDLPADWKNEITAEDKIELVRKVLTFAIDEDAKKFSLSQILTVPTACYFNGKIARQKHNLRRKTIDDSSRYALVKSRQYKGTPSKRLGKEVVMEFIPQDAAKGELYDEMRQSVEGFKNDNVPLRVKVLVVDYIFTSSLDEKK